MTAGITQTLFAQSLARLTGLSFTAALAWAAAEVGSNNNLGLMPATSNCPRATTADGKTYCAYPSPAAGASAAAQLINTSSLYAGIRASIGKSVQAQLDAIARSPWHLGSAGVAAAGGVDPYYARIFAQYGYVPGAGGSAGVMPEPTSTPPPAAGGSSGGGGSGTGSNAPPAAGATTFTAAQWNAVIARLGWPSTQKISANNYAQIVAAAATQGIDLSGVNWPSFYGKYLSDLRDSLASTGVIPGANLGLPNFLDFSWVPDVLLGAGVLAVVLVLAYSGAEELLG